MYHSSYHKQSTKKQSLSYLGLNIYNKTIKRYYIFNDVVPFFRNSNSFSRKFAEYPTNTPSWIDIVIHFLLKTVALFENEIRIT